MKTLIAPALAFFLSALSASATLITSNWSGGGSGTLDWEANLNWTPSTTGAPYPQNGSNTYLANIGDATGDRVIQTNGAITVSRLQITQSSVTGTNILQLGGDLTLANNAGAGSNNGFTNSTNDPSKLVIDLAGHNFTVFGTPGNIATSTSFTLTGGGVYQINQFFNNGSGNVVVQDGVTVKAVGTDQQSIFHTLWSSDSTFQFAANSATLTTLVNNTTPASTLGNFVVGDANNTVASNVSISNSTVGSGFIVGGNVDILTYAGSGGASAKLSIGTGKMNVGGNFTDRGTDSFTYGSGTIILDGGSATQHTLSTARAGLTTNFQVGANASTPGNIALGMNLTTTGSFTVLKESTLNVDKFALKANSFNLQSTALVKPTVAFTFGLDNAGLIDVGGLTLNLGTINVTYDGTGWTNGSNLTLFEFDSLTGTPNLTVNTFGDFSYDQLVVGANSIILTNVEIVPEPNSVCLLVMGAGLLLYFVRKRAHCAI